MIFKDSSNEKKISDFPLENIDMTPEHSGI